MKPHLRIKQFEFELTGGSGRVVVGEGSGSNADIQRALGIVRSAISGPAAPRSRVRDPETSRTAAARAAGIAADHRAIIKEVITAAGARGACAREIERRCKLTFVQVNRRLHEIEGIERRLRKDAAHERDFERRDGCAVWFGSRS